MTAFHCNTCGLDFRDRERMKAHYEGDLHNDNVKRRVNGLVPLTAQAHGARSRIATSVQSTSYKCTICDKRFATPQTLSSHLQSQKHKERKARAKVQREAEAAREAVEGEEAEAAEAPEAQAAEDTARGETDAQAEALLNEDEAWEATAERIDDEGLTSNDCLFCNLRAPTPEDALCHMAKTHAFTLPLADRVTDITGLLSYLALKVNGGLCFVCNDSKLFESRKGCQDHMVSQGHCMIKLSSGEYAEFYDDTVPYDDSAAAGERASNLRIAVAGRTVVSKHERKTHQTPMQSKSGVPEGVEPQQKLIAEGSRAHMTLTQMSRYQELIEARKKLGKKEFRMQRQHQKDVNKERMRLGVHLNNQHGKGYQGDYVGKTM